MTPKREDRYTVKAFDCHPDGRIKPSVLMQYLQEAAARHAEQLGFGFADMDRQNCFWVLSNLRLEITRSPRWTESFIVQTWPSGHTRLTATREFLGSDPHGTEMFRAGSEWMALDKGSGRPRNLDRLALALPATGAQVLPGTLARLKPADGYAHTSTVQVPFSALDFNGHVNNTEYIRWALDALHRTRGDTPQIRSVQVTYLAEVFEGDEIDVLLGHASETHTRILERRNDGTEAANVFLMEMTHPPH